ncbi:MAG TPA: methyltransferase, TIGR04325 family [Bacteroidota bacterium]|nr:methyltransferase, TIGR04325 family [Bacteroidota bacterium]
MKRDVKETLKLFVPPIFVLLYRRVAQRTTFTGNYARWDDALARSTGYDLDSILHKVTEVLLKVKRGEAAYERDSVLFDRIECSWPLLSGLLVAAARNNSRLNVVDIGGSLGSIYFQSRKFLKKLVGVRWIIVEQKKFIDVGEKYFKDAGLRFYHDLRACLEKEKPNAAVLSSVLPYVRNPYEFLEVVTSVI